MRSLLFLVFALSGPTAAEAASFADAQAAYAIFDVPRAERLYRTVAADPAAAPKDRAAATRELARIAWLVDGDGTRAASQLMASLPTDPDPCAAAVLLGRVLNDSGRAEATRAALSPYASRCAGVENGVALERVRTFRIEAEGSTGMRRSRVARAGLAELDRLSPGARSSAQGNRLRLALGLLAGDADQALAGWRSYFWLRDDEEAPPAIHPSGKISNIFATALSPRATAQDAIALATLLQRTGFVEDLRSFWSRRRLERLPVGRNPALLRLHVYLDLCATIGREILAHDRRFARAGAHDEEEYERRLAAILRAAAQRLDPDSADALATLRAELGVWGTEPGKTNGVSGVHLGHVVIDETRQVAQDGRSGTIRFVALDMMIHNSFSAWLMDGISAPGGWAIDGATIVQVRPRYLLSIDTQALLASPGPARERAVQEAEALRASDHIIALAEPISFLPGARARLRLQSIDALAAQVRATAPGADFEFALRRSYWDAMTASSITAHEGRHVLDQLTFTGKCSLPNEELEYRAKLSEIRFAPSPRQALASIYGPLFGGTSGHGIANKRLFTAYAGWMQAHAAEIAGYDHGSAPLEQLDRLTDRQIVTVAAGLEPGLGKCEN